MPDPAWKQLEKALMDHAGCCYTNRDLQFGWSLVDQAGYGNPSEKQMQWINHLLRRTSHHTGTVIPNVPSKAADEVRKGKSAYDGSSWDEVLEEWLQDPDRKPSKFHGSGDPVPPGE